jgi:cell division protein ZapB
MARLGPAARMAVVLYSHWTLQRPEHEPMEDADFNALTAKIDQLIRLVEQLRAENQQLRSSERQWREERARLVEQNELARHTVESMISRLKALEQDS